MNDHQTCSVCGESYVANWLRYSLYCGNACKQKAYRARKKQEAESKKMMMTFNEQMCYERMTDSFPTFDSNFRDFKNDHGLRVAIDMMYSLANILDNYDPDVE